jgi:hypothetical protein
MFRSGKGGTIRTPPTNVKPTVLGRNERLPATNYVSLALEFFA